MAIDTNENQRRSCTTSLTIYTVIYLERYTNTARATAPADDHLLPSIFDLD